MNSNSRNESQLDAKLDELLNAQPVSASADFCDKVMQRLRSGPAVQVDDEFLDRMLSGMPVQASDDFTMRTLAAAERKSRIVSFVRPALAAAASVAISISGIWALEGNGGNASAPAHTMAMVQQEAATELQQQFDVSEMYALAEDLSIAAPLLDNGTAENISSMVNWYE